MPIGAAKIDLYIMITLNSNGSAPLKSKPHNTKAAMQL